MADGTPIEWTHWPMPDGTVSKGATWNFVTGCRIKSPECMNCYAMRLAATRLKNSPRYVGLAVIGENGHARWTGDAHFHEDVLLQPLRWSRPRMIFVDGMSDLFYHAIEQEWIEKGFAVMFLAKRHIFQLLTKRPERALSLMTSEDFWARVTAEVHGIAAQMKIDLRKTHPELFDEQGYATRTIPHPLPNLWYGVSCGDQESADRRIPLLLRTPAAIRWLSAEPLIGPIDLTSIVVAQSGRVGSRILDSRNGVTRTPEGVTHRPPWGYHRLDWVVAGGESGDDVRAVHPDWIRLLRDDCAEKNVPFFFKQWGEFAPVEDEPRRGDYWLIGRERLHNGRDGKSGSYLHWELYPWTPDSAGAEAGHWSPWADAIVRRVGKKVSGNVLDGVQHYAFPGEVAYAAH